LAQTSILASLSGRFLSNEDEEIFFNSEDGQLQIARYISDGVTDFFNQTVIMRMRTFGHGANRIHINHYNRNSNSRGFRGEN
jgi:hypothetical protein